VRRNDARDVSTRAGKRNAAYCDGGGLTLDKIECGCNIGRKFKTGGYDDT
jgi:hypothetical protein